MSVRYTLECYFSPEGVYSLSQAQCHGRQYQSRAAALRAAMHVVGGHTLVRIEFGQEPNNNRAAHFSIRAMDVNGDTWVVCGSITTRRESNND